MRVLPLLLTRGACGLVYRGYVHLHLSNIALIDGLPVTPAACVNQGATAKSINEYERMLFDSGMGSHCSAASNSGSLR